MKMVTRVAAALGAALAITLVLGACNAKPEAGYATQTAKNTYQNAQYKVTVTAPDGWYVMSSGETKEMQAAGAKMAAGDNKDMKAALDTAAKNGAIFTFFRSKPGSTPDFNPSVAGAAESLAQAPSVKTGKDYLSNMKALMQQSAVSYKIKDEFGTRVISGRNFDRLDVTAAIQGAEVKQIYYAAVHDGDAVIFIESYGAEADRTETSKVIDTIKLDW